MRKLFILLLFTGSLIGCKSLGDAVINKTSGEIEIEITTGDGNTSRVTLSKDNLFALSNKGKGAPSHELLSVRAFDLNGRKIGEFRRSDLPNARGTYGRYFRLAVLDDGVYPVPSACLSGRLKTDQKYVKDVLEQERAYTSHQ